jgi:hypothetical protein
MNAKIHDLLATLDLSAVDSKELHSVEGGVVEQRDAEGNVIADCQGRFVELSGGTTIWVPYGTVIFQDGKIIR